MLLQLQHYDIEAVLCKGKNIPPGDALSRNYVSETFPDLTEGLDLHVHSILKSLPVCDVKIKQI